MLTSLHRFALDPSVSLARVAETLSFTYTGADLYALCSDAMLKAITRSAQLVDQRLAIMNDKRRSEGQTLLTVANYFDHHATAADTQVSVSKEDFMHAKQEMAPSVSLDELRHYEKVRDAFEGARKKPPPLPPPSADISEHPASPTKRPARVEESARPKFAEMRKQSSQNGYHGRAMSATGHRYGGDSDGDDDFVVRTEKLKLGNGTSRPVSSRGKGKGKAKGSVNDSVDGNGDGDLYD